MTVFGDKLAEALNNRSVESYIWKGPKVNGVQKDIRMVDCSYEDLIKYYNYCDEMINNKSVKHPGRKILIDIVSDQIQRCRAELLVRWLRKERNYTNLRCYEKLMELISENEGNISKDEIMQYPISEIYNGIPIDYAEVPVKLVIAACLDTLGAADLQHLTISFIIKLGLWFNKQEMAELNKKVADQKSIGNVNCTRLSLISEELGLDPKIKLHISDTGLSLAEFKTILNLKRGFTLTSGNNQDKYSSFTTDQLLLMSNKLLYRFQQKCEEQKDQWKDLQRQILEVAKHKGWDLHVA